VAGVPATLRQYQRNHRTGGFPGNQPAHILLAMTLRRLSALALITAAAFATTATPANAVPANACDSIIFNACFYPQPVFQGTEYRTTIYSHGCFTLPASRSYHTDVTVTVYSESDCTGQHKEISEYFGFDIGFDARSYLYPAA
jgi:hypothetical protein